MKFWDVQLSAGMTTFEGSGAAAEEVVDSTNRTIIPFFVYLRWRLGVPSSSFYFLFPSFSQQWANPLVLLPPLLAAPPTVTSSFQPHLLSLKNFPLILGLDSAFLPLNILPLLFQGLYILVLTCACSIKILSPQSITLIN